jgi:hypothetical protein
MPSWAPIAGAEGVGYGSREPVELGDSERVAFAGSGQGLVEARSGATRPGEPLVEIDPVGGDAERGELLPLCGEVLPDGAAPRVTNVGGQLLPCRV